MKYTYFILLLVLCGVSFSAFEYLNVYETQSGLSNLVSVSFEAKGNATNISSCVIQTHNIVDEDTIYWYKDFNSVTDYVNITSVFNKDDAYRFKVSCTDSSSDDIDSDFIILNGLNITNGLETIALCILASLLLILAYINKNILYLGVSAFVFLLFVKISESSLFTIVPEYVAIFIMIKIFFTLCLVAMIFERIFKKAI